jgi:hypothetical protein
MNQLHTAGQRHPTEIEWLLEKATTARREWKLIGVTFLFLSASLCAAWFLLAAPVYTARTILPLPVRIQALIFTEPVLDAVARTIYPEASDIVAAREKVRSSLAIAELKQGSGLVEISAQNNSPQRAQAILEKLIEQITAVSKPQGASLANIEQQIESEKRALTELKKVLAPHKEQTLQARTGLEAEASVRSLAVLVSEIASKEQKLWALQNSLEGFTPSDVTVRPLTPLRPDSRR